MLMKILLVGEYSGVHTNLAKVLKKNGHKVITVHDGDSYKAFNSDVLIKYNELKFNNKIINNLLVFYYIFIDFLGLKGLIQILFHLKKINNFRGYDVVQLINPVALSGFGSIVNLLFIYFLKKNNVKIFLCALGDDYYFVQKELKRKGSMFSQINLKNIIKFQFSLKYVYGFFYPYLNKKVVFWSRKIIPGLYDYYRVYDWSDKCENIVPIIYDSCGGAKSFKFAGYPIKIFHGWQLGRELKKGNLYFDKAMNEIIKIYPNHVEYKIVHNLPYNEYIKILEESIILFDQCYSLDKGVNALVGMATGKIVLTGNLDGKDSICDAVIDAKPDSKYLFDKIEELIMDPYKLQCLSERSLKYINDRHNSDKILSEYLRIWLE